ncbi:MAG: hypothetical protein KIT24_08110 [Phycisphaeraceae bacterium]|nr:hypothetical protein [Phycisphaeraceae bacterium]
MKPGVSCFKMFPVARAILTGLLLFSAALPAAAQRLQLGRPQPPALAEASQLREIARTLRDQIDQLRQADSSNAPRTLAAIELRELAIALLNLEGFPQATLLGLALGHQIESLDRLVLAADGPASEAALILIARDARSLAANPPHDLDDLRRALRRAFAELLVVAPPPAPIIGWYTDTDRIPPDTFVAIVDRLLQSSLLSPLAQETLQALLAHLDEADRWQAFSPTADHTRTLLYEAAHAVLADDPWIDPQVRTRLATDLSWAVTHFGDAAFRLEAQQRLVAMSRIRRIMALARALERSPAGTNALTEFFRTVTDIEHAARTPLLNDAHRLLALVHERQSLPPESRYVRQLRPAWRWYSQRLRAAESGLVAVLPRALGRDGALTDPAVVSAIGAHRRALDDLHDLTALNRLLIGDAQGADPAPIEPMRRLAETTLTISRDLTNSRSEADAHESLRALARQAAQFGVLPGERALRTASSGSDDPWSRLTGERQTQLLAAIDNARADWAALWIDRARPARGVEPPRDIQMLLQLCSALDDAAVIENMLGRPLAGWNAGSALNAWPGWSLSRQALTALAEGMEDQLAETTRLVLAGDAARATERLRLFTLDHSLLRLIASLERRARACGYLPPETPAAVAAMIASGPAPVDAWLGDVLDELALICRWTEELAPTRRRRDGATIRQIREYLRTLAEDVAQSPSLAP